MNSPSEKANELIEQFREHIGQSDLHIPDYFKETMSYEEEERQLAIHCAMTHVKIVMEDHVDLSIEREYFREVLDILKSQIRYEKDVL